MIHLSLHDISLVNIKWSQEWPFPRLFLSRTEYIAWAFVSIYTEETHWVN